MKPPVLRGVDLYRTFRTPAGAVEALRGVSVSVAPGEVLAVEGPSGSGKSTLLHLLAGLDRPDGGEVLVGTADLSAMSEAERTVHRRRHIGVVLQQPDLLPTLGATDNAAVPAILDGASPRAARARARACLEAVGLAHRAAHRPGELSGGEQQRLCVARALVNEPELLVADEPTATLDTVATDGLLDVVHGIAQAGCAVVVATHDARVAARAHRSVRLVDGAVVWPQRDLRLVE